MPGCGGSFRGWRIVCDQVGFSKIKTLMHKAAERTVENVWKRLGQLLDTISPQECANYFAHAGYASI